MQQHLNLVQGISKQQIGDIVTRRDEGAFALDNDGNLLAINKEAERILGWKTAELLRKNFFNAVDFKIDTAASIGAAPCAALRSVGCSHLQKGATIRCKDESSLNILFISIPIFEQGRMIGKVYVFAENTQKSDPMGVYEQLVNGCSAVLLKLDLSGKVIFANEYARNRFGDDLVKVVPADVLQTLRENPEKYMNPANIVNRCKDGSGDLLCMTWSVSVIRDSNGSVVGALCVGNDISALDTRSSELVPDKGLAQRVFQDMHDAILTIDQHGAVAYLNPVAERLTGWSADEARGILVQDVFHIVDSNTRRPNLDELLQRDNDRNHGVFDATLIRRDSWDFPVQADISPLTDIHGQQTGQVILFRNLAEPSKDKPWLSYNAQCDPLTNLMTRTEFELRLTRALDSARGEGHQHALCIIDIDNLAGHNKAFGRQSGDDILKQTASLISHIISANDVVARIGDDEFGVLLSNCSLENAQDSARDVCRRVAEFDYMANGEPVNIGVSIGLIPLTSASGGLADVMRIADVACYVAKERGRGRVHVYNLQELSMEERQGELQWIQKIRYALHKNQFKLYTQRILPVQEDGDNVPHFEILLRMLDSTGDLIRPGAFLPSAVRFNLMPAIDRWVLKHSLALLDKRVGKKGEPVGIYAINLSAQSLSDDNFLGFVIDQLDKARFPADKICFEITESTAISNLMSATRFMSIVRGMGCRFSLDDFGRGFSSYAYLKNLPLDFLKIDGSFIRELSNDPMNLAMVESINQIGHILGVQTIAEFVESDDTFEKLAKIGIDYVQGYQAGKPVAMQNTLSLVKDLELVD